MFLAAILVAFAPVTLQNASFELSDSQRRPASWTWAATKIDERTSSWAADASRAHSGRSSLRLAQRDRNFGYVFQKIAVRPGALYRISAWVSTEDLSLAGPGAGIAVGSPPRVLVARRSDSPGFGQLECFIKTGAGVESIDVALTLGSYLEPNTGSAWFDDVEVEEIATPPPGAAVQPVKRLHLERAPLWRAHPALLVLLSLVVAAGPVAWLVSWALHAPRAPETALERAVASLRASPRIAFVTFGALTLASWLVVLHLVGQPLDHHATADQHTLQALAWREGRVSYDTCPDENLELAVYRGRCFVSFPPVPTLFELPLTFLFGANTPNTLLLLVFSWLSLLICARMLADLTGGLWLGCVGSLAFLWGTNAFYLSLSGAVWNQGQIYGLFFLILSLWLASSRRETRWLFVSGLSLGLAVGCRPPDLLSLPLLAWLAFRARRSGRDVAALLAGLALPLLACAIYNDARFDSPFEFGHNYLPVARQLPLGLFSLQYLSDHIRLGFLKLPVWDSGRGFLGFSDAGTAVWVTSPTMILGLALFFSRHVGRFEKLVVAISLFPLWLALMSHESTGGEQFGYRYLVDLVPLLAYSFGRSFRRLRPWTVAVTQYSIAMNVYGAYWFYVLRWLP